MTDTYDAAADSIGSYYCAIEELRKRKDQMANLSVHGYREQTDGNVTLVNGNKITEEKLLRLIQELGANGVGDSRWLAIAKVHIELGFMALNRAIFKPTRVDLDDEES